MLYIHGLRIAGRLGSGYAPDGRWWMLRNCTAQQDRGKRLDKLPVEDDCHGVALCIAQRTSIISAGHSDASQLCGDPLTAKRSIKAKLGGNCLRCCHTVPVLPIGQQVLYFLPYGQWVGIRSRRALLGNHLWHSERVKPRGMQFHFLSGGYCSKPPFGSCKR